MSVLGPSSSAGTRRSYARLAAGLSALLLAGLVGPLGSADAAQGAGPGALSPNSDDGSAASQAGMTDILLSWAPVAGATGYEIELSDSESFDPTVMSGSSTTSWWALPATVPAGDYVWHVRAQTAAGPGEWSATASFTRSWEQAPAGLQVRSSVNGPVVTWDVLPGASFYEVEFSAHPFDEDPSVMQGNVDEDRYTCYTQHPYIAPYGTASGTEKLPGDEATCAFGTTTPDPRVKVIFDALETCEADGQAECIKTALDSQININPMATKQFFPLKRLPELGSAEYAFAHPSTYEDLPWYVRVRGRNGSVSTAESPFAAPALTCTGVWSTGGGKQDPETLDVTMPIPSGVPSYTATPECSSWSAPGAFYITTTDWAKRLSSAVTGASAAPVVGSRATSTPVLRWDAVAGAAKYRVYVGRTRDLRSADHVWETHATSLMPYGSLADARRIYWGVQACGWERCGPVGTVQTLTKTATSPVVARAAAATDQEASLSWRTQTDGARVADLVPATDSEARAYQVQLALVEAGWKEPAADVTVDAARLLGDSSDVSRTSVPLVGLPDGTYAWRVRALDESGFAYPWSAGTPFLRDVTAPTAKIEVVDGFDQTAPLTVTFSEAVTLPTGAFTVLDAAQQPVSGTVTGSGAAWAFTPRRPWTTGATYSLAVSGAKDPAGHVAAPVSTKARTSTVADTAGVAVRRTSRAAAWTARSASDAKGKSYLRTKKAKAVMTTTVYGQVLKVYACHSPRAGKFTVRVDGSLVRTVDLYRKYSGCGAVATLRVKTGVHKVTLSTTGKRNPQSRGTLVGLDAVTTA